MSSKSTRRRFVLAGAASVVGVGVARTAVDAASASESGFIVGRFLRAEGSRAAVVSTDGGDSVSVTLDSTAFVAHGVDGIVDTLAAFVPGERVAVRGDRTGSDVAAIEFQSVYTTVSGVYARDEAGDWIVTDSGQRVRIPQDVLQRDAPGGIAPGETFKPTIWTDPATGEAIAAEID
jgi:hypothetical protein